MDIEPLNSKLRAGLEKLSNNLCLIRRWGQVGRDVSVPAMELCGSVAHLGLLFVRCTID